MAWHQGAKPLPNPVMTLVIFTYQYMGRVVKISLNFAVYNLHIKFEATLN